jgi:hypothetical protein
VSKPLYLHFIPVKKPLDFTCEEPAAVVVCDAEFDTPYPASFGFKCSVPNGIVSGLVPGLAYHPGLAPVGTIFRAKPTSDGMYGFGLVTHSPSYPNLHFTPIPPYTTGAGSAQLDTTNPAYDRVVLDMSDGSQQVLYKDVNHGYWYSSGLFVEDLIELGYILELPPA